MEISKKYNKAYSVEETKNSIIQITGGHTRLKPLALPHPKIKNYYSSGSS